MFTFHANVPASLHSFLLPYLQAWINREDYPVFALETRRYGLVRFRRTPWPLDGSPVVVAAASEQDQTSCEAYAAELAAI